MPHQPESPDHSQRAAHAERPDRSHGQDRPEEDPLRDEHVEARVRPHRWIAWVWIVPIAAAGVVVWLAWRALAERGPQITISFPVAQGLQPGQTTIQHLNAVLGTVTSLRLTHDMTRVEVDARMTRDAAPY